MSTLGFDCKEEVGGSPPGSSNPNCATKYFKVYQNFNDPTYSDKWLFSFIGCFNSNIPLNIRLLILGDYNSGCIAFNSENFATINSGVTTDFIEFSTNSFNYPCNAGNKYYTVYAFVEDGDTTRATEPIIIRVGQPFGYSPKVKIEYDYYVNYNLWNIDSTKKTFSRSNPSFNLDIEKHSSSSQINMTNSSFTATDEYNLLNQITTRMGTYRNADTNQFPVYLNIAYEATITGFPFAGISFSKLYDNRRKNFSYVFGHNIAVVFGESTWNSNANYRNSTTSYTICHELLHQVGMAVYYGAHTDHDRDSCVLNVGDRFYTEPEYYLSGRTSWIVCPKHFNFLIGSPFITNQTNDNISAGNSLILDTESEYIKKDQNKSELEINIPKYTFKKYEPIMAHIKYINRNAVSDTLKYLFNELSDEMIFTIKPLDGQNYSRVRLAFSISFFPNPYIVQPNDTFIFSRNINRYGNAFQNTPNYFGMHGFLLPGRYEVTAKGRNNNDNFISNTVEFEVVENSPEDNSILELLFNEDYQTIILKYPDNSLTEAVYAYYVLSSFTPSPTYNDNFTKNEIIDLYQGFFNKYPNSIYNYNPLFIYSLFGKISLQSSRIEEETEFFVNQYPNTALEKFLNQELTKSQIRKVYNTRKKNKEDFIIEKNK